MLEDIGTPARKPVPRGNPQGRKPGEEQEKRSKKNIVFKSKAKENLNKKCINSEIEKSDKNQVPKKLKSC